MRTEPAFYIAHGEGFESTANTRGPWSPDHQHAGPPAALLARAIEQALPTAPAMHILRITYEILRPVPIAPLQVVTEALHRGRKLTVMQASLLNDAGKPLMHARAVAVRAAHTETPPLPELAEIPASPANSAAFEFDFFSEKTGYHTAMELRHAAGKPGSASISMWMRMRIPLLAGEAPSPLQRVVTAADSGNGVSQTLDPAKFSFVNPDLTVYLHRSPQGEWVCLQAQMITQCQGVGLADTRLYDESGPIGRSAQSLIIQPRTTE